MSADRQVRIPRWKAILYCLFHIGFILLIGTGLVYAHDMITQTDYFSTEKIIVKGNKRIKRNEILSTASIKVNDSLMGMNLKIVRGKILNHPWIKKVDIIRVFPDQLEINIQEENPVARVKFKDYYLINKNGEIFKKSEKSDPEIKVPEISGLMVSDIEKRNFYLQSALEILDLEKNSKNLLYPGNFSKIAVDRDTGICIYNTDIFRKINLGFNDFEEKYQNLKNLIYHIKKKYPGQIIEKIDLSKKNRVVIKPFPAMG